MDMRHPRWCCDCLGLRAGNDHFLCCLALRGGAFVVSDYC